VVGAVTLGALPPSSAAAPVPELPPPGLVVDVGRVVRPINQRLIGIHGRDDADAIRSEFDDLDPTTFRHVMSEHDFLAYDCETDELSSDSLDYFDSWLDAVYAEHAVPILSLSYVPRCYARDGQPKGPPSDARGYRRFLDQLLARLVTQRVAAGKAPLRRLELWNEPDLPLFADSPEAGHGYVGTLDEFLTANLPVLVAAIQQAEADSGEEILVGAPASFSPWPFTRYGATFADILADVNGFPRAEAEAMAPALEAGFGPGSGERIMHNGGLTWPAGVRSAARGLGIPIAFVSVHLYPNAPLVNLDLPEPVSPVLLTGRNPGASPDDFAELARAWGDAFGDTELIVSEWALSAGVDDRFGTCEAAAFDAAALSVMQETTIDRALYLGRPRAIEAAPFRAWRSLPEQQVVAEGPATGDGIWTTAAANDDRTTVLVSQWRSLLSDATRTRLPVRIEGLEAGAYSVVVESIGEAHQQTAGSRSFHVDIDDGAFELDEPIVLDGQAMVRVDIRRDGVEPLPSLSVGPGAGQPGTCLPIAEPVDRAPAPAPASGRSGVPGYTG